MQFDQLQRREFITLLGGAVASRPLAARAQQPERMRRIGVLMTTGADDPEGQSRVAAFHQGLQQWGWTVGGDVRIDIRFGVDNAVIRKHAGELAAIAPDVILANSSAAVGALLQATRTVPIVFAVVADPVGAGFVDSLARPGGNATGFSNYEYGIGGKWLELLKEIAPGVTRAAVIRDPAVAVGLGQFGAIQAVAPSLGLEVTPVNVGHVLEIERAIAAFARSSNGGLVVTGSASTVAHRDLIVALAARYRLPAVYPVRIFVTAGGLINYGPDLLDQFRRAAGYVDRILKGEKPADLPVQAPTRYELVINVKTAKALGLEVPPTLLARADEVIE
jgi:putative ABC transport system substrate-binding protein